MTAVRLERVFLKDLHPNPFRDMRVDPIDPERVEELKKSIDKMGFMSGGVVCRRVGSHVEIACGHHRIEAAIANGIRSADVDMRDLDDVAMIFFYANENATQHGNSATAVAGYVSAAVRFLAKAILTDDLERLQGTLSDFRQRQLETAKGQLLKKEEGLGWSLVLQLLKNVSGISRNVVNQQLANIKHSGDYARIIKEVRKEIEAEAEAERERLEAEERAAKNRKRDAAKDAELAERAAKLRARGEAARKAEESADALEVDFDLAGVSKHLKRASHLDAFREKCGLPGIKPYLPVENQAALAAEIVRRSKEWKGGLSAHFIDICISMLIEPARAAQHKINQEEREHRLQRDWDMQFDKYQDNFARGVGTCEAAIRNMVEHLKKRPNRSVMLYTTFRFSEASRTLARIFTKMKEAKLDRGLV